MRDLRHVLHPLGGEDLDVGGARGELVPDRLPHRHRLAHLVDAVLAEDGIRERHVHHLSGLRQPHVGRLKGAEVRAVLVWVKARHLAGRGHLDAEGRVRAREALERELRHLHAHVGQLLLLVALGDGAPGVEADDRKSRHPAEVHVQHLGAEGEGARRANVGLDHLEGPVGGSQHLHVEGPGDLEALRDAERDVLEGEEDVPGELAGGEREGGVA
mmetsp:Transcript_41668/g.98884  ORF Transcript_41668/g.98884 Transcript_41668/m.98884 type:complete len:215 (-) Transcript_41668:668-1312(-)